MSHDDNLDFRTTPTEVFALLLNADFVLTRRHVSSTQEPQNIDQHTSANEKPKNFSILIDLRMRMVQTLLTNNKYEAIIVLIHTADEKNYKATGALSLATSEKGHFFFNVYRAILKRTTNWQIVPTNNAKSKKISSLENELVVPTKKMLYVSE